jgi:hypothetical protein
VVDQLLVSVTNLADWSDPGLTVFRVHKFEIIAEILHYVFDLNLCWCLERTLRT